MTCASGNSWRTQVVFPVPRGPRRKKDCDGRGMARGRYFDIPVVILPRFLPTDKAAYGPGTGAGFPRRDAPEAGLRKLGVNPTCDPNFASKDLFVD